MRRRGRIVVAWAVFGVVVPAAAIWYATYLSYGVVAAVPLSLVGLIGLIGANRYWWRSLDYERTGERFGEPVYRLTVGGRSVEVWQGGVVGSSSGGGRTQFRVTVPLASSTGVEELEVHDPEWGMSRARTLSYTTGHDEFDDRFSLRGEESTAETLLTRPVREALLDLPSVYEVTVEDEEVTLVVEATLGVFSTDTVERYAEGAVAVADAVERAVPADRTR